MFQYISEYSFRHELLSDGINILFILFAIHHGISEDGLLVIAVLALFASFILYMKAARDE